MLTAPVSNGGINIGGLRHLINLKANAALNALRKWAQNPERFVHFDDVAFRFGFQQFGRDAFPRLQRPQSQPARPHEHQREPDAGRIELHTKASQIIYGSCIVSYAMIDRTSGQSTNRIPLRATLVTREATQRLLVLNVPITETVRISTSGYLGGSFRFGVVDDTGLRHQLHNVLWTSKAHYYNFKICSSSRKMSRHSREGERGLPVQGCHLRTNGGTAY